MTWPTNEQRAKLRKVLQHHKLTIHGDGVVEADIIAALEPSQQAATVGAQEPDMRHPKIQVLIGGKARREIELRLVEQLLDDPDCDLSAMDMEYWNGLHDKLRDALMARATPPAVQAPAPLPARFVLFTLRDLKAERKRLDGFLSLGNEVGRAAEYDKWIAALEAYAAAHGLGAAAQGG